MNAAFEWTAPRRIIFGAGRLKEVGALIRPWGARTLVFTGSRAEAAAPLKKSLDDAGVAYAVAPISGEPTMAGIRRELESARVFAPDMIVALGGGSVIDAAKAIAMLLTNGGDPLDYAEVIGAGRPITRPSLPLVAIPTTAGAGAEATRNAVLKSEEHGVKVSLRSPSMVPDLVVLDPRLHLSLPPAITAATGMDALAQLVEPYVSRGAQPMTDLLCREGIRRIAGALPRVCQAPEDLDARADMAWAATWSGIALANAGLGAAHAFAAAIGGRADIPHGWICAVMLAPVCRANVQALNAVGVQSATLDRYADIARLITGSPDARAEDAAHAIRNLAARLPLDPPSRFGLDRFAADEIAEAAQRASSMRGNPVSLATDTLSDIYRSVAAIG